MNNPIHVAFYLRSASGSPADLQLQQRKIEKEFARHGFESQDCLVSIFADSHRSLAGIGPELLQLIQEIKNQKIDVVMVSKMNRVASSSKGYTSFFNLLAAHKVRFISENENVDSSKWWQEAANEIR